MLRTSAALIVAVLAGGQAVAQPSGGTNAPPMTTKQGRPVERQVDGEAEANNKDRAEYRQPQAPHASPRRRLSPRIRLCSVSAALASSPCRFRERSAHPVQQLRQSVQVREHAKVTQSLRANCSVSGQGKG